MTRRGEEDERKDDDLPGWPALPLQDSSRHRSTSPSSWKEGRRELTTATKSQEVSCKGSEQHFLSWKQPMTLCSNAYWRCVYAVVMHTPCGATVHALSDIVGKGSS